MPNIPATNSICTRFAAGDVARAEDPQRDQRVRARVASRATNAGQQRDRDGAEAERLGRAPAVLGGLDDRVDGEHQRAGDQQRARDVGAAGRGRCPRRARAARVARNAVAMPIGRLTKKIQCQLMASVSTPPASRPIEPPAEATNA